MANSITKYLANVAGVLTEKFYLMSTAGVGDIDKPVAVDHTTGRLDPTLMPGGSPINTSAGAGSAGILPKLDAAGKLDITMMPSSVTAEALSVVTSENLAAGAVVDLYLNGGVITARNSDATSAGKEADGYVIASSTSPAANTVYFNGILSGTTGLTVGAVYYMDKTVPGGLVTTPPSATGNIAQRVGKA